MDRLPLDGVDVVHDLQDFPWPFADNEFDLVLASHVLEHIPNLLRTLEEVQRILRPHGLFLVRVPYYRSEGAFRDPTHVRFFTERTFDYFAPDGATALSTHNYYSSARFIVQKLEFGWAGRLSWHVDHYVGNERLRTFLHRALRHKKDEMHFTLVPVK